MATVPLADAAARHAALSAHGQTLLVEAGAGSGKTAVLAGRIAMMLLQGVNPTSIAAVTFTELAASELLQRVRHFVDRLLRGNVPLELKLVLPDGLNEAQRQSLMQAQANIDDVTCSTIHGFCQRLIRPYPVEANIDPGASIMDRDQTELAFHDVVDEWLREELSADAQGVLAELMLADTEGTLATVKLILKRLKEQEDVRTPAAGSLEDALTAFKDATVRFARVPQDAGFAEPETGQAIAAFCGMANGLDALDISKPAGLVGLLQSKPHAVLCNKAGEFGAFQKKGKWEKAAKEVGLSTAQGGQVAAEATTAHAACCQTWNAMLATASAQVTSELLPVLQPAIDRMQDYKRSAALMDFDDLLRSARNLLRGHPAVRTALAGKYQHVLVDEFQDTDPVQTEIFWRLCGDPPVGIDDANWRGFRIRPGALFLVGDPKQAIYRFRGADVRAYVEAREALRSQDPNSIIPITVNFRSCGPILDHVNQRFAAPLALAGQPGFIALQAWHPAREGGPCVSALDVRVADANGRANAEMIRDGEAEAVARLCAYLIGNELIKDPDTGERRQCRAGDIALLAPTGAELWRYEQALEDRGIPVATQAGKGFFRRQEVQDLIAITRVLADSRDSLALGALLRGPVVGLADEEILGILWALRDRETGQPASLSLNLDAGLIEHPLARDVLQRLQGLRLKARSTTAHNLLAQAVDELRVRPVLMQRHGRQVERALANVDLFLNLSRAYDIRGLTAFSDAVRNAWEDDSRAVEGRPDAQEESVSLFSMHAAKGLEWPVVVPINGATTTMAPSRDILSRDDNTLYCPILGVAPVGHEAALDAEKAELQRERVRLWYVAATRARELMVIPRLDAPVARNAWSALVDLGLAALQPIAMPENVPELVPGAPEAANTQTREVFQQEAARVAAASHAINWIVPSREEDAAKPLEQAEVPEVYITPQGDEIQAIGESVAIQGGRERGLVLHKLLEEVLTGETADNADSLAARAAELAAMLGAVVSDNPANGLSPFDLATAVRRTLAIDIVAALRPWLLPEFNVYASSDIEGKEYVRTGIVDAIAYDEDGKPLAVLDWKSDVAPTAHVVEHYKAQVRSYLEITRTPKGYVVFATTGAVHEVTSSGSENG
ncbi:UvrD-helicase domain-containing protein [Variovorax paradoxus]|uniref:UvrD-helicase domain-containing protein n=1 Tax=Variovorax paradoxus TaxID=34073 RepID=UPI00277D221A|nr:UvrD-helicase domain-containing protein [Variovorax paradoxus]MDP9933495.1 exodeoxyribonuclease-5 [Variovorax paradoxus]